VHNFLRNIFILLEICQIFALSSRIIFDAEENISYEICKRISDLSAYEISHTELTYYDVHLKLGLEFQKDVDLRKPFGF
jgi:hypothetical protein